MKSLLSREPKRIEWLEKAISIIVAVTSIGGGLFHLYTGGFSSLSSMLQTSIHWTLMLVLAFLVYPKKKPRGFVDVSLCLVALACGLFVILTWESRVNKMTSALSLEEQIFGICLIAIVLLATIRCTGKSLAVIVMAFILYGRFGNYMPGILYHKGYSWNRIISVLCYSENGIFGNALSTCATFIVLFVLFGSFLNACNGGKLFIDMAYSLTGSSRGGPAKTAILSSLLMGCISGSPVANVVTTGTFTIPLMKRAGYENEEACAISAVSATGGQIMPPVMGAAAFIMAEYTGVKYGELCIAAFIPALLYYISIFFIVDFISVKKGLLGLSRDQLPPKMATLKKSLHLFVPIGVLIACLIGGYSPMKTVFISILILVVIAQFRKETRINWRGILSALKDGIIGAIPVAVSCAAAGIIVGIVGMTGLGVKFSSSLFELSNGNVLLALVYTMVASLILGCGLPTTAVYIVLASMAAPALVEMGIPKLAAHMFVFYFGCISTITPPVALTSFAAAGIGEASQGKTGIKAFMFGCVAYIVPYMFVLSPTLLAKGGILAVSYSALTALAGVMMLASAVAGYLKSDLNILTRIIMAAGGILLVNSGFVTDAIGIAILAVVFILQYTKNNGKIAFSK